MAVKIQGTTVIDDGRNTTNVNNVTATGSVDLSSNTEYLGVPSGTTAERPSSPTVGEIRFNTDNGSLETYNGSSWEAGDSLQTTALNQTINTGETVDISLPGDLESSPLVSVTKEVPGNSIVSNSWDVAADGSNFELHDTAYSTSLTPNIADRNGTFSLGAGSFASTDVGKRIVGNGGEAVLTDTDGSYNLKTPFNDTGTISAGDWSMFALDVESDDAGLRLSGDLIKLIYPTDQYTTAITAASIDTEFWTDINSMTDDAEVISINTTVGTHDVFGDGSIVATYNFDGDVNDLGGSYNGTWVGTEDYVDGQYGLAANFNGVNSYIQIGTSFGSLFDYNNRYTLSFWLINTDNVNLNFGNSQGNLGLTVSNDGGDLIAISKPDNSAGNRYEYYFPDVFEVGDHVVIVKTGDETLDFYKNGSFVETWQATSTGFGNNSDNTIGLGGTDYTDGAYDQFRIFNRALSSSEINQLYNEGSTQIDTINSNDELYYAVSTDDRTTWKVIDDTEGTERSIVRNNSGTWEYNFNTTYEFETWVAASTNNEFSAINESMTIAPNRMNSAQLNSISDANHYQLGDDLDLSITFYVPDGGTRVPTSDGVSINYDSSSLDQGAILGTDYEYSFLDSTSNTLQFTALSTENFKIRVA